MKVAYVAGPYKSKFGKIGILINILKARRVAKELWKMGYSVVCPHSNSCFMDSTEVPDQTFLNGTMELLLRSDIIVTYGQWSHSKGTLEELQAAYNNNIPWFVYPQEKEELKWAVMFPKISRLRRNKDVKKIIQEAKKLFKPDNKPDNKPAIKMIEYMGEPVPEKLCTVGRDGEADDFVGCGNCYVEPNSDCSNCVVDKLFKDYARVTNQLSKEEQGC